MGVRKFYLVIAVLFVDVLYGASASAAPVTPTCQSFGSFPAADFGGVGIPTNAVCSATFGDAGAIALSYTQRFDNPAPTNDGAGTFFGPAGGDTAHGKPQYGRGNIDFYLTGADHGVLYIDVNPFANTDLSDHRQFTLLPGQDSWNQGFSFISLSMFDPNVNGDYTAMYVAYNSIGNPLAAVAIDIQTSGGTPPVPEPTSLLLLGTGLLGVTRLGRRKVS